MSNKWELEDLIYDCLGPSAGDIIADARKLSRSEARDLFYECLGPASGDILTKTRGKIFVDDETDPGYCSDTETEPEWELVYLIYDCLGPASGDIIADAKKLSKNEARDLFYDCLGPASGDVLT